MVFHSNVACKPLSWDGRDLSEGFSGKEHGEVISKGEGLGRV